MEGSRQRAVSYVDDSRSIVDDEASCSWEAEELSSVGTYRVDGLVDNENRAN